MSLLIGRGLVCWGKCSGNEYRSTKRTGVQGEPCTGAQSELCTLLFVQGSPETNDDVTLLS